MRSDSRASRRAPAATPPAGPRDNSVQSVHRAAQLLRAVAAASLAARSTGAPTPAASHDAGPTPEATVPALAAACGLHRATAYRILLTLETEGLLGRDPSGAFRIAPGLVEIAAAAGHEALVDRVHPTLLALSARTGETAALAVPSGGSLVYVDEVVPARVLAASWAGRSVPLHATSTGKAYLAALGGRERVALLGPGPPVAHTDTTITDRDALLRDLELTRERGYGTCRGELESTLDGVSSAVLDGRGRPVGVVSLWWPVSRLDDEAAAAAGHLVRDAAATLSRA
ncbi:IclR family transcriptional regulator [Agilicoccus flavus]|uniref:IclR family transcriptional regulator n=1 Tax=Agilicoccus flavus TaxID=2775968 RepID=UPI001CF61A91|nr:IclR family transcriptional regulator [Agilicoccus flavus]